jgi:DNA-nicking Smr family endonuclease
MSEKGYILDVKDMEAWLETTKTIKQLKSDELSLGAKSTTSLKENIDKQEDVLVQIAKAPSLIKDEVILKIGDGARINGNMIKAINKGKLMIDATLDLHGHTKEQAWNELTCFLEEGVKRNHRLLLIITGKGKSSFQNIPVLKNNLLNWLMASTFNDKVLYVNYAHPKHGGDGAFYILLKRPTFHIPLNKQSNRLF